MASNGTSLALARVVRAVHARGAEGLSDGQLLRQFLAGQDEAAFTTLVRRHGPMVYGTAIKPSRREET